MRDQSPEAVPYRSEFLQRMRVITSYSIHYTKLYEDNPAWSASRRTARRSARVY